MRHGRNSRQDKNTPKKEGLALLCLLGLAGCGSALTMEPEPAGISTSPAEGKAGLAELLPDPETQPTRDPLFSWLPRKPRLPRHRGPRWTRGFLLYDLSGRLPIFLGWHWGPDGPAWTRQTEYGRAWRLDGNYSHGSQILNASELFIPTEKGLQVWWCGVDSNPVPVISGAPVYWHYWIEQSLFEHGRTIFCERREEGLRFPRTSCWRSGPHGTKRASRRRNNCTKTNTLLRKWKSGLRPLFTGS